MIEYNIILLSNWFTKKEVRINLDRLLNYPIACSKSIVTQVATYSINVSKLFFPRDTKYSDTAYL